MASADDIVIDKTAFHDRLSNFITQWKNDKRAGDTLFGGAGSIVICIGKASDQSASYTKSAAFQLWLFGYEFPATLVVITQDGITFVTTKKKAVYIDALKGGKVPIEIHIRGKDVAENTAQFQKCCGIIKDSGNKVGILAKETPTGPFATEWQAAYADIKSEIEEVDVTNAFSAAAMSVKDENELRTIRDASRASSRVLGSYFVDEMTQLLDNEKKIGHDKLAEKVDGILDNDDFFKKAKISNDFKPSGLDWAVHPVIQSGGNYDLKFAAASDDRNLHAGVIIAALGLRYNTYASFVARTYLVDPSKSQESNYKFLLTLHESILKNIRDGAVAKDVYNKALALVKSKKPDLEKNFVKSVGHGIGIETKDGTLSLTAKSTRTLKDGMTLVVSTGFVDLNNPDAGDKRGRTYAMVLADTIRVTTGDAAVFSKGAHSDLDAVSFFFKDEEEPATKKSSATKRDSRIGAVAQQNITSTRLRKERQANHDAEKETARREHQKELHDRKQQLGLEKYSKSGAGVNGAEEKKFKRFESYKRDTQLPSKIKDMGIVLDTKSSTIVLPIIGRPVPFHVNTIKNASTTAEGEFTSLRINFLSPGQGVGRRDDQPFQDPTAQFVRSLTFRSEDSSRMEGFAKQITELKKESVRKEQEKKQLEDVVEQDKLVVDRRPQKLDMIFLRPAVDSKRVPGHVEIHQNGIRYSHGMGNDPRGTQVDVLFNNIRHLFFQPCKHELIVIIHLHLINPIMIGKRKTKDVQFFREATDMQFDETGNRKRKHRYGDEEEFEAEQEERRRRSELDKQFLAFAKKIEDAGRDANLRVDMPFRDLSFHGVPSRSNVIVQPTTDCLIQLTEPPFLVVTLDDIELVHLERVSFGLKNFDMVVIFKDFSRSVQHINTIPMESIDQVKDWLDSVEIPYYEGALNLQWPTIMKTVLADPHAFFEGGGWSFLSSESDSENEEESEEESAFEMDEDEFAATEESSAESDYDDNASADAEEDEDVSEVSEAESWGELERKAAKSDKQRPADDSGDDKKSARKRKR